MLARDILHTYVDIVRHRYLNRHDRMKVSLNIFQNKEIRRTFDYSIFHMSGVCSADNKDAYIPCMDRCILTCIFYVHTQFDIFGHREDILWHKELSIYDHR